jgi:hypothetical protein
MTTPEHPNQSIFIKLGQRPLPFSLLNTSKRPYDIIQAGHPLVVVIYRGDW